MFRECILLEWPLLEPCLVVLTIVEATLETETGGFRVQSLCGPFCETLCENKNEEKGLGLQLSGRALHNVMKAKALSSTFSAVRKQRKDFPFLMYVHWGYFLTFVGVWSVQCETPWGLTINKGLMWK